MQILKEKIVRYETDGTIVKGYDAGALIRCKDCKYNPNNPRLYADDDVIEGYIHCGHLGEDGYCSLAERKEE